MAEQETNVTTPRERVITIPDLCLVVLIGATGSGKSTFAATHFRPTEILSSDHYRGVVGDDPNDQSVSGPAFEAVHYLARLRLRLGKLTVIDATNVKPQDRAALVAIAREHDVLPVAIVLNIDERICRERNTQRPDRQFGPHVIRNHIVQLRRGLKGLEREGFRYVTVLNSPTELEQVRVERTKLFNDRRDDVGPFDIVGDVHGCYEELIALLTQLGYTPDDEAGMRHPDGRRVIFLGDLVDRGPDVVAVVDLAMKMIEAGQALCVPGNHDIKLMRALQGRKVTIKHGLTESLAQIDALPPGERQRWSAAYVHFADGLISHYVLDGGKLVVAHAGMREAFQGRSSRRVRDFALYGETTGETDEFGLPERIDWAADYRGSASVIYGHTPVPEPVWVNNTLNIDTGCVFGGKLTALRWPERDIVSVPARHTYAEHARPLRQVDKGGDAPSADTLLRIEGMLGKQHITTRLLGNVTVEAGNAAAALEVMSRFALDPRWLIYLPPTMSPSETTSLLGLLEHPAEALAYYRAHGVARVVCEEKHMGSRAVLVLCRDEATARRRFGDTSGTVGACYTRTGRRFFDDDALDHAFVGRCVATLAATGFWERFATDWVCLDAEIMPWSVKAQGLLREQYAPVAAAGSAALSAAQAAISAALQRGIDLEELQANIAAQQEAIIRYTEAYRRYCWETEGLAGIRVAPFHVLATEGKTYFDRDHAWHMSALEAEVQADPLFMATRHRVIALDDEAACGDAVAWWEDLTANGGEGMVVKPFDFVVHQGRSLLQPAVKCRGHEYLRIIYGPAYTLPENLERLRKRGLGAKRALALREFALGVESLELFVAGEPLWRVHQAVFGVLALESEPVDPRL